MTSCDDPDCFCCYPDAHACELPDSRSQKVGDTYDCDCGKHWTVLPYEQLPERTRRILERYEHIKPGPFWSTRRNG